MLTRRLTMVAVAAAFAVSSSLAMLQSSRPALADADDHHPKVHRHVGDGDHDRDDRRVHPGSRPGYHWANGQWVRNNYADANNPGNHKGWKPKKHKKDHDRDDRR